MLWRSVRYFQTYATAKEGTLTVLEPKAIYPLNWKGERPAACQTNNETGWWPFTALLRSTWRYYQVTSLLVKSTVISLSLATISYGLWVHKKQSLKAVPGIHSKPLIYSDWRAAEQWIGSCRVLQLLQGLICHYLLVPFVSLMQNSVSRLFKAKLQIVCWSVHEWSPRNSLHKYYFINRWKIPFQLSLQHPSLLFYLNFVQILHMHDDSGLQCRWGNDHDHEGEYQVE